MIDLRSGAALVIVAEIINGVSKVKIVLLAVVFSVLVGCATGDYAMVPHASRGYEAVVELDGRSSDAIFDRASAWFDVSLIDSKDVVQNANKKAGRIIVKAVVTVDIDAGLTDVPQS